MINETSIVNQSYPNKIRIKAVKINNNTDKITLNGITLFKNRKKENAFK